MDKKNQIPVSSHHQSADDTIAFLETSSHGLSHDQVKPRLDLFGKNILPVKKPITIFEIFFHQFLNPLIYILAAAAAVSIFLGDYSDAFFIGVVLLLNAVIGTFQEFSAEKSAQALRSMTSSKCFVERDGRKIELATEDLVPGDLVLLESGNKVPADLRLIYSNGLEIDESLLTGESVAVFKDSNLILDEKMTLADRKNMAFTASLVTKGRGRGIVVATASKTELGKIAKSISFGESAKPPLVLRMDKFTKNIAVVLILVTLAMALFLLYKGQSWHEVLMFSVALAVSAIPEGLPVALTVALSIASRKMAKRNVIVRKLPAVEALGSCSFISTDKTGTLTVNQLTIKKVVLPNQTVVAVDGSGLDPEGITIDNNELLNDIVVAGVLCNESQLLNKEGTWEGIGDAVDLAFMVLAHKAKFPPQEIMSQYELLQEIPFEPENQYAATLHKNAETQIISIKGALEKILQFCSHMIDSEKQCEIKRDLIIAQAEELANAGYRVLALASKRIHIDKTDLQQELNQMVFLGIVAMIDPLRPEAADAVRSCHEAGIEVAMVTGDHPITALAIAKELGLAKNMQQVISGPQLKLMTDPNEREQLFKTVRVFARVEPQQKLEIVQHLIAHNHFVAVTGDGANDAPALRAANVGVAMGKSGTDIAKETADLVITDDRFASIVAGIEEGRVAYNNVRKVVYLLISTGVAEIILFTLSLLFDTPLPLTAVQILWLNLVTNGIQDIGLAFEPAEGDELSKPPRKTNEPIFDRLMLERIFISSLVMGVVSFIYFNHLMNQETELTQARNMTLLLLVLFENIMIANCRSETKSAFSINPFKNKILFFGTIIAQLIHIATMYIPSLGKLLGTSPVSLNEWSKLLMMATSVLFVIEVYKLIRRKRVSG